MRRRERGRGRNSSREVRRRRTGMAPRGSDVCVTLPRRPPDCPLVGVPGQPRETPRGPGRAPMTAAARPSTPSFTQRCSRRFPTVRAPTARSSACTRTCAGDRRVARPALPRARGTAFEPLSGDAGSCGRSVPAGHVTGHAGAPAICSLATATVAASGSATPFLTAVISARIEIAISGGVRLPM